MFAFREETLESWRESAVNRRGILENRRAVEGFSFCVSFFFFAVVVFVFGSFSRISCCGRSQGRAAAAAAAAAAAGPSESVASPTPSETVAVACFASAGRPLVPKKSRDHFVTSATAPAADSAPSPVGPSRAVTSRGSSVCVCLCVCVCVCVSVLSLTRAPVWHARLGFATTMAAADDVTLGVGAWS